MNLVREHIYEKFTEDSDPIKDLGIELYAHRNFNTREDSHEYLYKILPILLKINNPKSIIPPDSYPGILVNEYYQILFKYCNKYFSIKGTSNGCKFFPLSFKNFILRKEK